MVSSPSVGPRQSVPRAVVAVVASGGGTAALAGLAWRAAPVTGSPDAVVTTVVLATGAVAGLVLCTGCLLLLVSAAARGLGGSLGWAERAAGRLTPLLLRRALAVTVGTGLGLAPVCGTAVADEVDVGWQVTTSTASTTGTTSTVGARPADAATASTPPVASVAPPAAAAADVSTVTVATTASTVPTASTAPTVPTGPGDASAPRTVVVRPGDCLWDIAAAHLPAGADDAAIAAAWPRLYAANRDVVGPDPNLVLPGQVLVLPEGLSA